MSTNKQGLLTASGGWRKHLRKYGRRVFWKTERAAVRKLCHEARVSHETTTDGVEFCETRETHHA